MQHERFYLQEVDNLRSELQFLKGCQLRYFLFSITFTSTVLSALGALVRGAPDALPLQIQQLVPIAPMLIIIPCWWIFFDKATTITRIVGYIRVSESKLISGESFWIGWENSLREFRKKQSSLEKRKVVDNTLKGFLFGLWRLVPLFNSQKYWTLNFITYMGLSVACIWTSNKINEGSALVEFAIWASAITFICNLVVLGRLIDGDHSYRKMEEQWKNVL